MPKPYRQITTDQFADLLDAYHERRKIDAIHLHHTWRPNHSQWKGLPTIEGMARYHIAQNWGDIAQHITLDPTGKLWTGRDWNTPPTSARGYNGNEESGPFMIEMIGDFDTGKDPFKDPQRGAAVEMLVHLLRRFNLDVQKIRFHNQMTKKKSCPGTAIDRDKFLADVAAALAAPAARAAIPTPFRENIARYLLDTTETSARDIVLIDAEPAEESESFEAASQRLLTTADDDDLSRGGKELSSAELAELIPHVVNMRRGRFASTEKFLTTEATVNAIFDNIEARIAKQPDGEPLRIVLWAHGGLIPESDGLEIAYKHVWWWDKNGAYPIYFVWETGFWPTITDALSRARDRLLGRRGFDIAEWTSDMAIAGAVRLVGGIQIWDGMKYAASAASASKGGAEYIADKLAALQQSHAGKFELHAIGHSAGSIFHSYFLPLLQQRNLTVETMQFLAPAIRVDEYLERLDPLIGGTVKDATIYTMHHDLERKDTTSPLYRKSLLYLISHGLEHDMNAELLGLEESIKKSKKVAARFGVGGPGKNGRIVWSFTKGLCESRSHGGFDDDEPTMNSVGRRVLGIPANKPLEKEYEKNRTGRSLAPWEYQPDIPSELQHLFESGWSTAPAPSPFAAGTSAPPPPPPRPPAAPAPGSGAAIPPAGATGRRRALCVGINAYASAPLFGCVADAQRWAAQLRAIGFEQPRMLTDAQATRQQILTELEQLFATSSAGDVLVFQAAGHGTTVPDLDGDDANGQDQAFCPYDYHSGALLIDDDVAELFERLPPGVLLTCFFDFCHSGTATRFAVGRSSAGSSGARARFIAPSAAVTEAHAKFRARESKRRDASTRRGPDFMREVVFSACRPDEVAWESGGAGDFTRNATPLLGNWATMTNQQFYDAITSGFQPVGRQHPILDCAPAVRSAPFLGGSGSGGAAPGARGTSTSAVARALRDVAAALESGAQ